MDADATYCDLTDNYPSRGSQLHSQDYIQIQSPYNEPTGSEYGLHYEPTRNDVSEHSYRLVNSAQVDLDLQSECASTVDDTLSVRYVLHIDTTCYATAIHVERLMN